MYVPATGYGLGFLGINPGGGEIFCTCPDRPWGTPSLLYNGYRVCPGGKEQPGRDADPSPTSSAAGYGRVELYLYSPYGLYGLYKASVSVRGCTLPYVCTLHFVQFIIQTNHSTTCLLTVNICIVTLQI